MKVVRKKRKKIKIEHNKKLFWIIIFLLAILIVLMWFRGRNREIDNGLVVNEKECEKDEDCVPATCCHPDSCTVKEKVPACKGVMCTLDCSGPLDCGAGSCGCVKGKCEIIEN